MENPIALPVAELKPAVTGLGKIINKRATLAILSAVKIERTSEGWVTLTATDLDRFATVRLEQPTAGEAASVLIPYEALVKITRTCGKTDVIAVKSQQPPSGTAAIISYPIGGQQVSQECESFPLEEFPSVPQVHGKSIPLPDEVRTSLADAFECASTDETRYILNGVYVDTSDENGHYLIATDGRQLYSSNSFKLELPAPIVIPSHRFIQWKEFNQDGQWLLTVGKLAGGEAGWLRIDSRRWTYTTRLIEGSYPNWRQVVPEVSKFKTKIELETGKLESILQTLQRLPCHDEQNHTTALEVKQQRLYLLGKSSGATEWTRVEVPVTSLSGKEVLIALNREYLARAFEFGLNTIQIIDEKSPLRVSRAGRQMIIMPVRSDGRPKHPLPPHASGTEPEQRETSIPADATEADATTTERNHTMNRTSSATAPDNNGSETTGAQPTIAAALEQIETIKGSYRQAIQGLNALTDTLKAVHREQRASEKEVQTVRATLNRLQSVRL